MSDEKKHYYTIADVTVAVSSDLPITDRTFGNKFSSFHTEAPGRDVVFIHHRFEVPIFPKNELVNPVYRKIPWHIYRTGSAWLYAGVSGNGPETSFFQAAVFNDDHSRGTIYHGPAQKTAFLDGNLNALTLLPTDQILLARVMADRDAVFLHAAGVVLGGEGYLFVGHSSAGKSTMCGMLQAAGGTVLCDDRIVVRRHDDGYRIHGTWSHGDVPDVSSASAPLKGIYFLEQAAENELIPMADPFQNVQRLLPCLIKGLVTPEWMEKACGLVEALAADASCFRLRFDRSGEIIRVLSDNN